jgi:hypothetical protein
LLNINYDDEMWFCELQICVANFLVPVLHASVARIKFELTGPYRMNVRHFGCHRQSAKNSLLHYQRYLCRTCICWYEECSSQSAGRYNPIRSGDSDRLSELPL